MIVNLGSINIDRFYRLPHLPQPGETLAALDHQIMPGGKGLNQSVAALRAGARVVHVGAIGADDDWTAGQLAALGLSLDHVARVGAATGHAIVCTDPGGENLIVIHPGANRAQSPETIAAALALGRAGDSLLLQNETSHQVQAAHLARARGMRVLYSAAPFDLDALRAVLPHATHLLMNALEAAQLEQATGQGLAALPVQAVIVTRGAAGADWIAADARHSVPAPRVQAVDTTGAGDCFAGNLAAALDSGLEPPAALARAVVAAAIQVTRPGAAPAMPWAAEIVAAAAS